MCLYKANHISRKEFNNCAYSTVDDQFCKSLSSMLLTEESGGSETQAPKEVIVNSKIINPSER